MAISYVGGQTATLTSLSNQTVNFALTGGLASTPAADDFVIISYAIGATTDAAMSGRIVTTGYTLIADLYANDTDDTNLGVFTKPMGSSPDTAVEFAGNFGTGGGYVVNIKVFRGVSAASPLDATTTTATGVNTGNANPPAITPVTSDNVIAIFSASATSTTLRTYTTASTSYMSGFQQANSAGTATGSTSGSGYVTGQSPGVSYDPTTWSLDATGINNSWAAATLALRPENTTPITGTADGTLTISGASTGAVIISAAASGTVDVTGASSGATLISAAASGALDVSGASVGAVRISGAAAGSYTVSGSATGGLPFIFASASGTLTIGGASTGVARIAATASGAVDTTGTSSGGTVITGTASSTYTISGKAAEGISRMRYGEIVVTAAYFGDIPVNVIAVGDHVVLEW